MSEEASAPASRPWWKAIGPGLVTACVVIGPGSITTSTNVGAADGYSKSWVVVLAVVFMLAYMQMAARLGVVSQTSTGDLCRKHAGQWLALLIGVGIFFIAAAFQFGNNLGVHAAITAYTPNDYKYELSLLTVDDAGAIPDEGESQAILAKVGENLHIRFFNEDEVKIVDKAESELTEGEELSSLKTWVGSAPDLDKMSKAEKIDKIHTAAAVAGRTQARSMYTFEHYWVLLFNGLALAFVFGFKNLYSTLEKVMSVFVSFMLLAFFVNVFFAKPAVGELAAGFIPSGINNLGLPLVGLIGTTFVIAAAYYQSYLARFKGWEIQDLKAGAVDARVSAIIMALITLMLMTTAAAVLKGEKLGGVSDIANALYPLFGEKGRIIFCVGLFCAAFSSFIVNSMIGGFILADGLKMGSTPQDKVPRILTGAVLIVGMGVALYVIKTGVKPMPAIVAAQAVTVIAAPLMAVTLLWLCNRQDIMGEHKNGPVLNAIAGIGLLVLVIAAYNTAVNKVLPKLRSAPPAAEQPVEPASTNAPAAKQ